MCDDLMCPLACLSAKEPPPSFTTPHSAGVQLGDHTQADKEEREERFNQGQNGGAGTWSPVSQTCIFLGKVFVEVNGTWTSLGQA